MLNPYSKAHVLTNSEIEALYGGVDSQKKMENFCKYIDKNGGDLQKVLTKSDNAKEFFKESPIDLSKLESMTKAEKNKTITEYIESLGKKADTSNVDASIKKLMNGIEKKNGNKIASFARGLNSIPSFLVMFLISPFVLGWFIPRLTYANTRRLHEQAEKQKAEKQNINTAA